MTHVVILGNGISGVTAARHLRKLSNYNITIISKETDYFFSRTALMYIYMGHMRYKDTRPYEDYFWEKNNINICRGEVISIDTKNKILYFNQDFEVDSVFLHHAPVHYDILVLATGSQYNVFDWPGVNLNGVSGLYSIQDLQYLENLTPNIKKAVIVGGGLIGIELAEMLHTRQIEVTFLVRESSFWNKILPPEESKMVNHSIIKHGIDLRLDTELQAINGSEGSVTSITTDGEEEISCQYVGLTVGVHPQVSFLVGTDIEINKGIIVNESLRTNIKDIYAIGDCAEITHPQPTRSPIEAVWYTGRMMGETVAYHITGHDVTYDPGIWFNSAKFFNIEYQVYGTVPVQAETQHNYVFWRHPSLEKSIRIYYHIESGNVKGFLLMGIRFRHEICAHWIRKKTHIEQVLTSLSFAEFDPEFSKSYVNACIEVYNASTHKNISLNTKRGRTLGLLSILKRITNE